MEKMHPVVYRKTEAICLAITMIWVLPDDHYPHIIERAFVERAENVRSLRENSRPHVLLADKFDEIDKIGFPKFVSQRGLPIWRYFHVHVNNFIYP